MNPFGERLSYKKTVDASPDDVEKVVVDLLGRATHSVDYSTGLWADFYRRPNVANAFAKAAETTATFRLLLDSDVDVQGAKADAALDWVFKLRDAGKIEVRKSADRIQHRIIIDNRDFRLESPSTTPGLFSNFVLKNADESVKDYTIEIIEGFNEDWEDSEPVS
ncbi:MAG: hypothetical protein JRN58_02510 [Nitrososphaerota archaeon]|nr:hypothetical protein [Nitrososphaerota archaeon]MDG6967303.1 hypothetical protein [Nitrososphaerota archaeon]MDG6977934.1 hypothetical protein [Nitrososphaerota archaeon]